MFWFLLLAQHDTWITTGISRLIMQAQVWLIVTRLIIWVLLSLFLLFGLQLKGYFWKWTRRNMITKILIYLIITLCIKSPIMLTAWVLAMIFFFNLLGHCSNIVRNSFVNSSNKFRVVAESIFQFGSNTCINHSFFNLLSGIL